MLLPQTAQLREARPERLLERIELTEVPFFPQQDYQCGPAALATSLVHFGAKVTPEDLVTQVYLPARKGSLQIEMLAAARRYGMVSYRLAPRFEDLLREVAAGNPVIVLLNYGVWPFPIWHYAVVAGYDYSEGQVVLRSGEKERLTMPFGILEYLWKKSNYWAMVAVPSDRIPATATESDFLAAIVAMERLGDARAVVAAYATFLRRWPANLAAAIGLANGHYAAGELEKAAVVLRRAADLHPDSVAVLNNLAQTLSDLGRDDEALGLIDRAVALDGSFGASARETRELILQRLKPASAPGK
ncbi:MAG: PA2778 family cysteine peptidase [Betaproteobacteria bacterium]|nr:PA2778 family cysteine peptidase [Betaproteobacteria bacterium]